MATRTSGLAMAVRVPVVLSHVGQLTLVLAALSAAPALVALAVGEWSQAWRYAVAAIALAGVGWACRRRRAAADVQANEAIVVATLMFIIAPVAMTWPMMAAGPGVLDALFEAVSGVTTTGLTTLDSVEDKPVAFLFTRAWMQWYGGLGIAVLAVALLMRPGAQSRRFITIEPEEGDIVGSVRNHARRIAVVYLVMTVAAIVTLSILAGNLVEGALHALSAVSTGGFSTHDGSLAGAPAAFRTATILFSLAGAMPLALYYTIFMRGWRTAANDIQWRAVLISFAIVAVALLGLRWAGPAPTSIGSVGDGVFTALTAQTTAGFTTLDPAQFDAGSKFIVILAMFAGGSCGSTAGGVKVVRLLVLASLLAIALKRTCLPRHAVVEPTLERRGLDRDDVEAALLVVGLFSAVIALSWMAFLIAGHPPLDALFDVVSATGTVGLSTGVTNSGLEPGLKLVLCLDMLMGRLEVFALLVLAYPRTWLGPRRAIA